eukprot:6467589-Amphidinium_carterae.1
MNSAQKDASNWDVVKMRHHLRDGIGACREAKEEDFGGVDIGMVNNELEGMKEEVPLNRDKVTFNPSMVAMPSYKPPQLLARQGMDNDTLIVWKCCM